VELGGTEVPTRNDIIRVLIGPLIDFMRDIGVSPFLLGVVLNGTILLLVIRYRARLKKLNSPGFYRIAVVLIGIASAGLLAGFIVDQIRMLRA
jgi:hypothetical protein